MSIKIDKQGNKRGVSKQERKARVERKENRELSRVINLLGDVSAAMAAALAQEWGY
jgi:hypothetical protein